MSLFVHTFFKNLYLGIFALLGLWLGTEVIKNTWRSDHWLLFNDPDVIFYSDLNQFGSDLNAFLTVEAYWLLVAMVLFLLAYLFWQRGLPTSTKEHFALAKRRLNLPVTVLMLLFGISAGVLGMKIYRQEQAQLAFSPANLRESYQAYQKKYSRYAGFAQPKIVRLEAMVELYPEEQSFTAEGHYVLVNKEAFAIDTLLVRTGFDEISSFSIDAEHQVVEHDSLAKFTVLKLEQPLQTNDSLRLSFNIKNTPNTLFTRNSNVLSNGTFLKQDIFPRIGYKDKTAPPHPADSLAKLSNYLSADADLLTLELTVGTAAEQTVIAPGVLQKQWQNNGRSYFSYRTPAPVKFSFGINSGVFEAEKVDAAGRELAVHYHPPHRYNVQQMLNGLQKSLAFNEKHFGRYQHQQAQIAEFPRSEGSYATTFGNSIPTSELRFLSEPNREDGGTDLSFYVPAHELTHQWWGNQLIPANALGALFITESITEYISLQVYREAFGEQAAIDFLKQQHKRYSWVRKRAGRNEQSLALVPPSQSSVAYGKGAIALNALGHHYGHNALNQVLRSFMQKFDPSRAPYPTSLDLIADIKAALPDSLQPLAHELLEEVVTYEASLKEYRLSSAGNKFNLEVCLSLKKFNKEEELTPDDLVEVAVYNVEGERIALQQVRVQKAEQKLQFELSEKPYKIVLDPHLLLLNISEENNELVVEEL